MAAPSLRLPGSWARGRREEGRRRAPICPPCAHAPAVRVNRSSRREARTRRPCGASRGTVTCSQSCGTAARTLLGSYHGCAGCQRALREEGTGGPRCGPGGVVRQNSSQSICCRSGYVSTHLICNLVADRNVLHFPASPLAGEPTPLGSPPKTTPPRSEPASATTRNQSREVAVASVTPGQRPPSVATL